MNLNDTFILIKELPESRETYSVSQKKKNMAILRGLKEMTVASGKITHNSGSGIVKLPALIRNK